MLLLFTLAVLLLSAAGLAVVGLVGRKTMKRLGLDLWNVLLWLGVAEAQVDEVASRRLRPVATPAHVP